MHKNLLKKCFVGVTLLFSSIAIYATPIEGYWKSVDDRTGEQLSIVEIRKGNDGLYHGKIVYRYPNPHGVALSHCVKCPAPYTNQPILGLEILSELKDDPNNPNAYIDGKIMEPTSGRVYKGKAVVTSDGKRLRMRGYMGISVLGRTVVWIRTEHANP
ncbi:DUF2147 domain-containing protein [Acinetobacter sp. VNH17]|uniref:DUF2147 domain-containing protein n=1 Tax=Acinetobacter thutiue TaxID=2998078 RepID=A0ABT7WLH6_9GAMM|nr:DUF2147 domain-containing protein [Acinetobacter thutiue]MCY6411440.1 DUF2147 domain-containing protein [Acinetobacter thutiue]MDN0013542.1 DUF2147 domain-containing protein [Acinetobacter thutiue]